jgi:hypothetical protein
MRSACSPSSTYSTSRIALIYILFTPIKKEMAFTDLQLAILGTTSFVIFYIFRGSVAHFNQPNLIASGWKFLVLRLNEQTIIASRFRY